MKCIAAVVVIAFVGFAQAGVLPLAYAAAPLPDGTYTSIPAPSLIAAAAPSLAYRSYEFAAPAPFAYAAPAPFAYAAAAPAPLAYAAAPLTVAAIPGEARYTALNRGAIHDAPLPGHALSQTSLNLAPAPGTF